MDRYTAIVALSGQICGTLLLVSILVLWFRRKRPVAAPSIDQLQRIEARIAELQHAIDSVAVEVERISEGQRFTTRLLSERTPAELSVVDGSRATDRSAAGR